MASMLPQPWIVTYPAFAGISMSAGNTAIFARSCRILESTIGKPHGPDGTNEKALQAFACRASVLAEWTGLEPATPGVTGRYSNQLNYHSMMAFRFLCKRHQTWRPLGDSNPCSHRERVVS